MQAPKLFKRIMQKLKGSARSLFVLLFQINIVAYAGIVSYLSFFQDDMIFPGAKSNTANVAFLSAHYPNTEMRFHFDEATLHGWHLNEQLHKPVIFYYGGNADELSNAAIQFASLTEYQSVFINYRGYGMSIGTPTEEKLYSDALQIFDYIVNEEKPEKVFVIGRSLGTGVATYVASQRKTTALVLVTPFDSIAAVSQARYPYIPIELLIKHRFDSLSRAEKLTMPTLVLMAENDKVVLHENTEKLLEKLPDVRNVTTLARTNHGNIVNSSNYLPIVKSFLSLY